MVGDVAALLIKQKRFALINIPNRLQFVER